MSVRGGGDGRGKGRKRGETQDERRKVQRGRVLNRGTEVWEGGQADTRREQNEGGDS